MKIISKGYFGENIQFICECCNSVYEVESRDDWKIKMVYPSPHGYKVPNYSVICPNCGSNIHLGYDPDDLLGTYAENTICSWIPLLKERKDWNDRYRVEPIRE